MNKYRILNSDHFDETEDFNSLREVSAAIQDAVNSGGIIVSDVDDIEVFVVRPANVSIDIEVTVTVSDLGGNN